MTLAGINNRDCILEPSASTGVILRTTRDATLISMCDVAEINNGLVRYLRENFNSVRVQYGDFMEWQPVQYYSRVIMNSPFNREQGVRHILRAFSLLRPGGVLVAICLNGPRQQEKLLPFSDIREELPRGTFAYTDTLTMIIRLRARRLRTGGRISARLPAPGKDRTPVALKGTTLTRRPFHYAETLLWASVFSDLSFVCY